MANKYPFSPGTLEGEALKKLTAEEQNAILQNTKLWDEAHSANEEITRILKNTFSTASSPNLEEHVEDKGYEGMDEIVLNSLGGRKIYVSFLEADDSTLTHTLSNGLLSNFPEREINDNPLLVTKNERGDYHFGFDADKKRKEELGMRSLRKEEVDSPEFEAYLTKKLGSDRKNFPGFRGPIGRDFGNVGDDVYFWGGSIGKDNASNIGFNRDLSKAYRGNDRKSYGFTLLGVKD